MGGLLWSMWARLQAWKQYTVQKDQTRCQGDPSPGYSIMQGIYGRIFCELLCVASSFVPYWFDSIQEPDHTIEDNMVSARMLF